MVILSIVPLFMFVGKNFLPVDDQSQFELNVRAPEGSTLASTSTLAERIATDIGKLPGVTDTLTTIGGGQQEQVNVASIYVKLQPIEERGVSQNDLMIRARDEVLAKYLKGTSRASSEPACNRWRRFPAAVFGMPTFST